MFTSIQSKFHSINLCIAIEEIIDNAILVFEFSWLIKIIHNMKYIMIKVNGDDYIWFKIIIH